MASRSVVVEELMSMSAISASAFMPEEELFRYPSGAIRVLAVYSLGVLRPIINPMRVPMPHTFRINFREFHTFLASSNKSISCSCGSGFTFSSFAVLLFICILSCISKGIPCALESGTTSYY